MPIGTFLSLTLPDEFHDRYSHGSSELNQGRNPRIPKPEFESCDVDPWYSGEGRKTVLAQAPSLPRPP